MGTAIPRCMVSPVTPSFTLTSNPVSLDLISRKASHVQPHRTDSVGYIANLVTTGQEVFGWTPGALMTAEQC